MKRLKRFAAFVLAFGMAVSLNFSNIVRAEELAERYYYSSARAISGVGSANISGSGSFRVNCSGWSLFGKATITVSGANSANVTTINILAPNGRTILGNSGPIVINGNTTFEENLVNISASYYTIEVVTTVGSANVTVRFGDR